jgi:glycosyltransferase involved in cell wall biosynthesis
MTKNAQNRILFLNENPLPAIFTRGTISGKELRLRSAIHQISEIHVIAPRGKSVEISDSRVGELERKIIIHHLIPWPYYLSSIILFIYGIYYTIRLRPIIIEAEGPLFSGPVAVIIGKLFSIPSLVEVRSDFARLSSHKLSFLPESLKISGVNLIQNLTIKNARVIIANSHHFKKVFLPINPNIYVVNPGIQYPPSIVKKLPTNILTFGYLGRLVPEKRIDLLLNATLKIVKEFPDLDFQVLIAGEGVAKKSLQIISSKLKLQSQVKFIGLQPNFNFLSHIDILVNPLTVLAPLEMVHAEAAYMQVPVICFGNSTIPETVKNGVTGLVVQTHSSSALTTAMIQLARNEKMRHFMQKNSHSFANSNYSFASQVSRLKKAYKPFI